MKRVLLIALALALGALVLAGCGGGGSSGGEESKVEATLEKAIASKDGSECTRLETQKFLEQSTFAKGEAAVESCEAEAGRAEQAEAKGIENVEVKGKKATAEVEIEGARLGGQTLEVGLVKQGGGWKIDRILGFAELNQEALAEAFDEELGSSEGVTPEVRECIIEKFEDASQEEVEGFFLGGSGKPIEKLAESCQ